MQSKQAFPLFIALVTLITFSLRGYSQTDSTGELIKSTISDTLVVNVSSPDSLANDTLASDSLVNPELSDEAIESQVNYSARDTIKYNFAESKVYLYGDAVVTYENIELRADYIELQMDSNIVFAEGITDSNGVTTGSPVFREGEQEYKSQRMTYNFKTEKGKINEVITQDGEGYVHGEDVKKTENDIVYIQNGLYTTCEHEHPHFSIWAKQLKVIPDDKIVVKPANLIIEDVNTPVVVPFGVFPNRKGGKSGIKVPMPGESANDGFYLINGGYYLYMGEKADLLMEADIYTKGSYTIRPTFRYKKRYKRSGTLSGRYKRTINGVIPEDPDYSVLNDYWLNWKHMQEPTARPNSSFNASVDLGTQTSFANDLNTNDQDFLSSNFQSNISYTTAIIPRKLNVALNARHSQNNQTGDYTLTLPEATLTLTRIFPFKSNKTMKEHWYDKVGISYRGNFRNQIDWNTNRTSYENRDSITDAFRNGIAQEVPISLNLKVLKHFTLTPSVNYRELWYFETYEKRWSPEDTAVISEKDPVFSRANSASTSANLTTKIYGMRQFKRGNIRAIRHVVTPSVGVSYTPENRQGLRTYTDTSGNEVEYSIYEQGIFGRPDAAESGKINLGMLNSFEMKTKTKADTGDGTRKIKLLENFNLSTGYDWLKDSLHWDNVSMSGFTNLTKNIDFQFNGSFDLYDQFINDAGNAIRINQFEWNNNRRLARLTSGSAAINMRFSGGDSKKKKQNENDETTDDPYLENGNSIRRDYVEVDWDVPWNVVLNYSLNYSKPALEEIITMTTQARGDFKLTRNWSITYDLHYDFENLQINYARLGIVRNLHCWEMSISWVPLGARENYFFNIRVTANILSDLKLEKQSL